MAISARIPSTLGTNKFIKATYDPDVIEAVKSNLIAVPRFDNAFVPKGNGDTIYISKTNTVTATEVTIGTEGATSNPFNTGAVTLTINQYWEANPVIDDPMSMNQSHIDLQGEAVKEAAYAISKKMDSTVCDLFSALSDGSALGTDGSAITDDVLISAVEELDEADVPETERTWMFDPSAKADIMKIDKFVRIDYGYGEPVPTGIFRKDIYGSPLLITNNLTVNSTGNYGAYAHKKAIAIRIAEKLLTTIVEQPLKHQTVIQTKALWGVIEVMDDFGTAILTRLA